VVVPGQKKTTQCNASVNARQRWPVGLFWPDRLGRAVLNAEEKKERLTVYSRLVAEKRRGKRFATLARP
jgi:hypothetical protein